MTLAGVLDTFGFEQTMETDAGLGSYDKPVLHKYCSDCRAYYEENCEDYFTDCDNFEPFKFSERLDFNI